MNVAEIGDVIAGRYKLTSVLGEGGMGAVYAATQMNLNRTVAIKLMHAQYGVQLDSRQRFEREARVSAALHHPNAVKIFDFGEDEGRLFLVMEQLEGTSLRTFVEPGKAAPLPHARTVDIGLQIAEVLIAAHKMGLVHRDLKPENIFLEVNNDGTDRVVVVDFGLAFIEEREDITRMTQEGMIMGTPIYMSPEQCMSKGVGTKADIYSFGCMLYEMATATIPFEGSPMIMLSSHIFQPPKPPRERVKDIYIPSALERLILSMLQKDPAARPNAEGVAEALAQLKHTLGDRERARGAEHLKGRAVRMIPTVRGAVSGEIPEPAARPESRTSVTGGKPIAVLGPLDEAQQLGLHANGYLPLLVDDIAAIPAEAVAIYAGEASDQTLNRLLTLGRPVVACTPASDMDRVSRLLALGVADVVTTPLKIERLAKKLGRVIKRAKRGKS